VRSGDHGARALSIRSESRVSSRELFGKPVHHPGGLIVAKDKSASPSWTDVRASLFKFDRAGLRGIIQDLYATSTDNQAFLHARFGLGPDLLGPYKATISRWINPDLTKGEPLSISKAKKAIADYEKAIGRPEGLAELTTFYCEEAFSFVESCSFESENYLTALIRMYDRSVNFVLSLPVAERPVYVERLGKLRLRAKHVGWGVEDELSDRCRLDLEDRVPDHSTFSVNRHGRFRDSDIFRRLFEAMVRACMDAGLVKGEGFAVDASVMEANASRYHGQAPDEIDWSTPERQTRAVVEFLSSFDDENADADRKLPKVISPTDPCSAWTAKANKRVQFGYGLNYMIDTEHAVIVDVEATPARTFDEVAATRTMIDRTETAFGLRPQRLAADTAYGTGRLIAWLLDRAIAPHIPVWERYPPAYGMFSRSDFAYDAERDVYICPNGRLLKTTGTIHDGRVRNYLSHPGECRVCTFKERCTRAPFKKIARDINEDARDYARSLKGTPEFERSSNERKKVEMRFAHLKVHHAFERMRLRGLTGARDEFRLGAIVQNLKTLANHMWRPITSEPIACMA
jgi:Transposase DDE domain/Transposase domain (DUF772)